MKITDAVPNDIYEIRELRLITWLETYPNKELDITKDDILESFEFKSKEAEEEHFKKRKESIKDGKIIHTWVAKDSEKIVGFCVASIKDYPRIIALYVLPNYQEKGVGSGLISKAIEWLGNVEIKLEVVTYNSKAIRFYEKFGFVIGKPTMSEIAKLPSGKILPEIEMIRKAT